MTPPRQWRTSFPGSSSSAADCTPTPSPRGPSTRRPRPSWPGCGSPGSRRSGWAAARASSATSVPSRTPYVVLRADIDALAVDDVKNGALPLRVPGVAHACGHDVHTAVVLGAGLVLARCCPKGSRRCSAGLRAAGGDRSWRCRRGHRRGLARRGRRRLRAALRPQARRRSAGAAGWPDHLGLRPRRGASARPGGSHRSAASRPWTWWPSPAVWRRSCRGRSNVASMACR